MFAATNNINVTGGILEINMRTGNSSAEDRDYTIRSNAPFGNLRVLREAELCALLNNAYPLTLVKNLEVVSGVLNTQNTNVTVGGNIRFYNGAKIYTAGSGTLTLNGADDQQFRIDLAQPP